MESTSIHNMKIPTLIRSHIPIVGVSSFVAMFGDSKKVSTPNTRSNASDARVYVRNLLSNTCAPEIIIVTIRMTVNDAHVI
jgi:hypothetical protein